ncbi:MAG: alpha-N-acetylglucosaminidase C-terminal domain-containing protein, partial [Ruminococcus sp.]|nr:alpha-N-acetylglucosaminidase C-terminal domain-containing protein [Candidatus Copronaster equi]
VKKEGYDSYLSALGSALSDYLGEFDERSVCYTHTSSIAPSFLKNTDGKRYIFIDDENLRNNSDFLNGKQYLVVINGNRYGRTGIYGNVDSILKNPFAQADNACGTSLDFDTFEINPMFCAAALKIITMSGSVNSSDFIKDFSYRRYRTHAYDDMITELKDMCNSEECPGSIICARPCTNVKHTAPFDKVEKSENYISLYNLAKKMLESEERKTAEFRKDIQSIVRQFLADFAYPVYLRATSFFYEKNVGSFEQASNIFLEICEDMDRLLKTTEDTNICTKYIQAQELGDNKEEKEGLQINFLLLHTLWGPIDHSVLYDTAWAEWGGLVKDYYAGRWYMYFRSLAAYFKNPKKLKDNSKKQPLDRNEYKGSYQAKRLALFENNFLQNYIPRKDGIGEEDTIEVIKDILTKYSEIIDVF